MYMLNFVLVVMLAAACQIRQQKLESTPLADDIIQVDVSDINSSEDADKKIYPFEKQVKAKIGVYCNLGLRNQSSKARAQKKIIGMTKLIKLADQGKIDRNLWVRKGIFQIRLAEQNQGPTFDGVLTINFDDSLDNLEKLFKNLPNVRQYQQHADEKFNDVQKASGIRISWDSAPRISPNKAVAVAENVSLLTAKHLQNKNIAEVIIGRRSEFRVDEGILVVNGADDLERMEKKFLALADQKELDKNIKVQRESNKLHAQAIDYIGIHIVTEGPYNDPVKDLNRFNQTLQKILKLDRTKIRRGKNLFGDILINESLEKPLTISGYILITPETSEQKILEFINSRVEEDGWADALSNLGQRRVKLGIKGKVGDLELDIFETGLVTVAQEQNLLDLLEQLLDEGYRFGLPNNFWVGRPEYKEYGPVQRIVGEDLSIKTDVTREQLLSVMRKD